VYGLPGVFADNPLPQQVNGSLWTLFYEVACYAMVAIVGVVGWILRFQFFRIFILLYTVSYIAIIPILDHHQGMVLQARKLSLPFVIGMAIYHFRGYLRFDLRWLTALTLLSLASYGRPWFYEVFLISWCYAIFFFGFLQNDILLQYNRLGDYSYGMYIYAFPVEQTIVWYFKTSAPGIVIAASFPITLFFAILSWHFVERPALSRKAKVADWLRKKIHLIEPSAYG